MTSERRFLRLTRRDGYQHIEIDYGEKKNALTPSVFEELRAAVAEARRHPEVRALLLSGRGDLFCGGADLDVFKDNPFAPGFSASPIYHCIIELLRCHKPIVAAVQGAAVGAGATLLLSCDIVVTAQGTRFVFPFSNLGINAELGATYLLPLTVGLRYAAKWLLLAEPVDSTEALQAGLVTEVVPEAQLQATAQRYLSRLTALAPRSLRTTKRLLRHAHMAALQGVLVEEFKALEEGFSSAEAQEAIAAFKGKRTPDFGRFT